MEEKVIKIIDEKTSFQNTLDIEIFSRFLGLWIMKMEIPKDIFEHVQNHDCPSEEIDTKVMIKMILGADDTKDSTLRQLIIPLI